MPQTIEKHKFNTLHPGELTSNWTRHPGELSSNWTSDHYDGNDVDGTSAFGTERSMLNSDPTATDHVRLISTNAKTGKRDIGDVVNEEKFVLDETDYLAIQRILLDCFRNGFPLGNGMELKRFRRACVAGTNINLEHLRSLSDAEILHAITRIGITIDDVVYVIEDDTISHLCSTINCYMKSGGRIVFYDALRDQNVDWLTQRGLARADLIRAVLQNALPEYTYGDRYFGNIATTDSKNDAVRVEIERVTADCTVIRRNMLERKLNLISPCDIEAVLNDRTYFVPNDEDTWIRLDMISDDSMKSKVMKHVSDRCDQNGFASLYDLPVQDLALDYPEITPRGLENVAYWKWLHSTYRRCGRLVYRPGNTISAKALAEEYCVSAATCCLHDVEQYVERLLGGSPPNGACLQACCTRMVRVDEDRYVSDKDVTFDVTAIDALLESFIPSRYVPIRQITSFSLFPPCGHTWNTWVLESFCRRFSRKFDIKALCTNVGGFGVITRKSCRWSYDEIMADAAMRAGLGEDPVKLRDFLKKEGYLKSMQRSRANKVLSAIHVWRAT